VARARRGDLSGPVLAILVTLILLAIGAVIIAYFTLFAGGTAQPIITVTGQPVAYKSGTNHAVVNITVVNTGSAQVNLSTGTKLEIKAPFTDSATLGSPVVILPGETKALTFNFSNDWPTFRQYRMVTGMLTLKDSAGNIIGVLEVSIRVIGGG